MQLYYVWIAGIQLFFDRLMWKILGYQMFGANMDKTTERRHYLNHPFEARYVRIHPHTWHNGIGLRAALLGCPHQGECGPGFFQINAVSGCRA